MKGTAARRSAARARRGGRRGARVGDRPGGVRRSANRRPAAAAAGALRRCRRVAAVATACSRSRPPGAAVHRWIDQTLGVRHAHPGVFSLPAPGRLLVSGSDRSVDGLRRRRQAPARTVAAGELVAARPLRAARRSRSARRRRSARTSSLVDLAAGDPLPAVVRARRLPGRVPERTDAPGDRRRRHRRPRARRANVSAIAPAWRCGPSRTSSPTSMHAGAWSCARPIPGSSLWSRRVADPRLLSWASDGTRLLVVTTRGALVLDAAGRRLDAVRDARRACSTRRCRRTAHRSPC